MRISVIIPARNAERTLAKTLASLAAQTLRPAEIVVVDDASEDKTAHIACGFPGVTYLRSTGRGAAAARNAGAAIATGEALYFCDADIVLEKEALERLAKELESAPDAAFVYSAFLWHKKIFGTLAFSIEALKCINYISTMSLVRREAFPGFDESLPRFQDWDVWLTIAERGGVGVHVREILFSVIEHGTLSRQGGLSRLKATWRIRQKHHLAWRVSDLWLAFKESVRARRV